METQTDRIDFFAPSSFSVPPPAIAERIRKQAECRLLWAVLQSGIEQYMKYATATNRRGQRLHREAKEWIMRDDYTWLCSFVNICLVLGLDPEYLRDGLKHWYETQYSEDLKQAA